MRTLFYSFEIIKDKGALYAGHAFENIDESEFIDFEFGKKIAGKIAKNANVEIGNVIFRSFNFI